MPKRSRFAALSVNKPQRILTCNHGGRYGVPSCLQPTVVCKSRLWLQRLLNLVPTPSIKQYRTNNHITSASVSVQPCLVDIFRYKMWGILSSLLLHSISVFRPLNSRSNMPTLCLATPVLTKGLQPKPIRICSLLDLGCEHGALSVTK